MSQILERILTVENRGALLATDENEFTALDIMAIMDTEIDHAHDIIEACVEEERFARNDDGTYRVVKCSACKGTGLRHVGETYVDSPCPRCEGQGQ